MSIREKKPDVEAIFENRSPHKDTYGSGGRPAFLVKEDYLTTGEVVFLNKEKVSYGEQVLCHISFLTPEVYPESLWIGKKIEAHCGARIVGYATITKIMNKTLERKGESL